MTATLRLTTFALVLALLGGPAGAQSVTSAFQGFSGRSDQPVEIEADTLEVRETDQAAIFTGNVVVVQGDSTLKARTLTVFYSGEADTSGGPGARQIRRLEAEGSVSVSSSDQRATGARGVFDLASNTVTLTGGVILAQGNNVLRGDRLFVDLTTQRSRIETSGGGRVQGIFSPGEGRQGQ